MAKVVKIETYLEPDVPEETLERAVQQLLPPVIITESAKEEAREGVNAGLRSLNSGKIIQMPVEE